MGEERRKGRRVSDRLAYRDEYNQHFINLESNDRGEPVFISVTCKSADLDKVERAMKRIKEFIENEFKGGP